MADNNKHNDDAVLYVGDLDQRVTENVLLELMSQAGRVAKIYIPRDKDTMSHYGYGFVEYENEENAEYAIKILNNTKFYGKTLRLNSPYCTRKLFNDTIVLVQYLSPEVDEKLLFDIFSVFGLIIALKIVYGGSGDKQKHGLINLDRVEACDAAVECLNGHYLAGTPITVTRYHPSTK